MSSRLPAARESDGELDRVLPGLQPQRAAGENPRPAGELYTPPGLHAREHAYPDRHRFLLAHALGDRNGVDPCIVVYRDRRRNAKHPYPFGLEARQRAPQVSLRLVAVGYQHQPLRRLRREAEYGGVQRLLEVRGALVDRVRLHGARLARERHG